MEGVNGGLADVGGGQRKEGGLRDKDRMRHCISSGLSSVTKEQPTNYGRGLSLNKNTCAADCPLRARGDRPAQWRLPSRARAGTAPAGPPAS